MVDRIDGPSKSTRRVGQRGRYSAPLPGAKRSGWWLKGPKGERKIRGTRSPGAGVGEAERGREGYPTRGSWEMSVRGARGTVLAAGKLEVIRRISGETRTLIMLR
jgi:hypothetical protein